MRLKTPAALVWGVSAPRTPMADTDTPPKVKLAAPRGKPADSTHTPSAPRL